MQTRYIVTLCILSLAAGAALTRAYAPREVIQTKIVEKSVTQEKVVTHTKQVARPDGTVETDTTTEANSTTVANKQSDTKQTKAAALPNWNIAAGVGMDRDLVQFYSVHTQRRILGNVFVGVWGNTNEQIGVSLGLEF